MALFKFKNSEIEDILDFIEQIIPDTKLNTLKSMLLDVDIVGQITLTTQSTTSAPAPPVVLTIEVDAG